MFGGQSGKLHIWGGLRGCSEHMKIDFGGL